MHKEKNFKQSFDSIFPMEKTNGLGGCDYNCKECPAWQKSLFKDFDEELLKWLASKKIAKKYNKGDILFSQGDQVDGLYCHSDGLAKVIQKDNNDKIRFSRLVFPGDTSGHRSIFIQNSFQGTSIALSSSVDACFIPVEDILYLLSKNPSFAKNLIIKISHELKRSEEEQMATKEKTVRSRLAELIYRLGSEYSEILPDGKYLLKSEITKREFAKILLVADETIIRLMSEMMKEGLISYMGKRLVINDLKKIQDFIRC